MRTQKISCDVCGTEKKETNHWFTAWYKDPPLQAEDYEMEPEQVTYIWLGLGSCDRNMDNLNPKDICGQACLQKIVGQFAEGKL